MNVKELALDALKCPVRRALKEAWDMSRGFSWRWGTANQVVFDPDGAVDKFREHLGRLVRERVLEYWEMEVHEGWLRLDWQIEVKFTFRQNGAQMRGSQRYRAW